MAAVSNEENDIELVLRRRVKLLLSLTDLRKAAFACSTFTLGRAPDVDRNNN